MTDIHHLRIENVAAEKMYIDHLFQTMHYIKEHIKVLKSFNTRHKQIKYHMRLFEKYLWKYLQIYSNYASNQKRHDDVFDLELYMELLKTISIKNVFHSPLWTFSSISDMKPRLFGYLI